MITVTGNDSNNFISKANDRLNSWNINGKGGDDVLIGGDLRDVLRGGDDRDTLLGGNHNDALYGQNGDDYLSGGLGNDNLSGGNHNDILVGGLGNDFLDGGDGNDTLVGNQGNDVLTGGEGNDTFFIHALSEASDIITDFNWEHDKIYISEDHFGAESVYDFHSSYNPTTNTESLYFRDQNFQDHLVATLTNIEHDSDFIPSLDIVIDNLP